MATKTQPQVIATLEDQIAAMKKNSARDMRVFLSMFGRLNFGTASDDFRNRASEHLSRIGYKLTVNNTTTI